MGGLVGLTGATGYIGGRLLHALESRGERVRCLSRRPEYLEARVGPGSEVVRGDVSRPRTLRPALEGVETAYYLVHSMGSAGSFAEIDRKAAAAFARAARAAGRAEADLDLGADRHPLDVAAERVGEKRVPLVPTVKTNGLTRHAGGDADLIELSAPGDCATPTIQPPLPAPASSRSTASRR